jgi:hypothetical protein
MGMSVPPVMRDEPVDWIEEAYYCDYGYDCKIKGITYGPRLNSN